MARPQKNTDLVATLTKEEEQFLWYLDVARMSVAKAGELTGIKNPNQFLQQPHVMHHREVTQRSLRSQSQITREDCLEGFKEAIDHARLLGKPEVMIAGWTAISKLLGYDAPKQIDINVMSGDAVQKAHAMRSMPLANLIEMTGDIVDAEFVELFNK
jgi:hypothetical protein